MPEGGSISLAAGRTRGASAGWRAVVLDAAAVCALAAVYFIAARAGLAFATVRGNVTPVWPPAGIAVAALVLLGMRFWPGVAAGAFAAVLSTGLSPLAAAAMAAGNTAAGLAAAFILERASFRASLARFQDVAWFVVAGVVTSPLISASAGCGVLAAVGALGPASLPSVWSTWFAGDAAGVLLVAPPLFVLATLRPARPSVPRALEFAAWLAVTLAVSLAVFGAPPTGVPMAFAVIPVGLWAAIRFGPPGAAVAGAAIAAIAVRQTALGLGPFGTGPTAAGLTALFSFLASITLTGLVIAAVLAERARALSTVRESEHRYRAFIEHSAEAVWRMEFDPPVSTHLAEVRQIEALFTNGRVAECNDAFARLCGATHAAEMHGRLLGEVFDRNRAGTIELLLSLVRSGYRLVEAEAQLAPPGSTARVLLGTITGIVHEGELVRVWGVQRDVTAAREAEERLRESRSLVQGIAEATPDLLHVYDLVERRTVYTNRDIAAVLGHPPAEDARATDALQERLVHPEDLPLLRGIADRLRSARDGEFLETEYRMRHHDGGWRWFLRRDTLFTRTPDGLPALSLGVAQDITERKKAEEAVWKANEDLERRVALRTAELEASNRELEAFSYSISHDLRAPLRAIDGYAHMLLEDHLASLDANGQRHLHMISRNCRRMGELVDDLLAFSRVGRKPMEKEPVDMEALVRGVLADLSPRDSSPRGTVTVHALPPAFGDPALLRQVWTNLLSNALKFSARTPHPRIDIAGRIEGGDVVYAVSDNGIGFDMQYAHKLFGVFERLHPAEDFEGTGVGLALVQRIVQRHGGRAWAQGTVNRGATFSFSLPAV